MPERIKTVEVPMIFRNRLLILIQSFVESERNFKNEVNYLIKIKIFFQNEFLIL